VTFTTIAETKFHKLLFEGLEQQGLGKWGFAKDPYDMAHVMIDHIDKKREALGIMGERERVLMDMADRRDLEVIPDSF
jgi:carbon-monoxide dehydrogenase catalytic subunit